MLQDRKWDDIIQIALDEDIGAGDMTTLATVSEKVICKGSFIAKEAGTLCGLPVIARVFALIDDRIKLDCLVSDGEQVSQGCVVATISGPAQSILTGERVALNFLQHLSGIATQTREAVEAISGSRAQITDTRKTTPGLRRLEKYAVRKGGAVNHRFNLADGILIKDNHIRAAGGIRQAIERARQLAPHTLKIEVETENEDQVEEALQNSADIIMLDNMCVAEMTAAVTLIAGRALVEASGNMGDRDLKAVAATGVDLISIGTLTHSVRAMDISLRFSAAESSDPSFCK